jgi:hypothetical protein
MQIEDEFWKCIRRNFEWNMYPPDLSQEYIIRVFDDGNERYKEYENGWYKYGEWLGKVALVNKYNNLITIGSISLHKIYKKTN